MHWLGTPLADELSAVLQLHLNAAFSMSGASDVSPPVGCDGQISRGGASWDESPPRFGPNDAFLGLFRGQ